ncbi:MAG: class A beta-lactamase [Myxococcales bacterium]|nr:class A beta-lactamase [Myxococcales bacterium]
MTQRSFTRRDWLCLASLGATARCHAGFFAAIERRVGGRVGLFAFDTNDPSRRVVEHRADERFAMASTFKWALAAAVLARVDRGELSLEQRVPIAERDLLAWAPVVRARLGEGSLSIEELCEASVVSSDNSAANLLLPLVGGPAGWTTFARRAGDCASRLDRDEPSLNTNIVGDVRDTTTPRAMARLLAAALGYARSTPCAQAESLALSVASRERLRRWMLATTTGRARLRAGLSRDWVVGDKTGTGERNAVNDVAFAERPGRPGAIVIALYLSDSVETIEVLQQVHRDVAAHVARALGG